MTRPLQVGIVACSAEGAALCYRTICHEGSQLLGAHAHPDVSLQSLSLADYVVFLDRDDWAGVAELMLDSARKLAAAGADFLICPDNTCHQALPYVLPSSPLPWLHIAEAVSAEASARGFHKVGITGTHWLVASDVYPDKLRARGLSFARPSAAECERMGHVIMSELVQGVFRPETTVFFQQVICGLKEQGCDSVVLGCTEIPLIIRDDNSALPTLDSTRLLAKAAVRHAIERAK